MESENSSSCARMRGEPHLAHRSGFVRPVAVAKQLRQRICNAAKLSSRRVELGPDAHEAFGRDRAIGAKGEKQRLVLSEVVDESPAKGIATGCAPDVVGRGAGLH